MEAFPVLSMVVSADSMEELLVVRKTVELQVATVVRKTVALQVATVVHTTVEPAVQSSPPDSELQLPSQNRRQTLASGSSPADSGSSQRTTIHPLPAAFPADSLPESAQTGQYPAAPEQPSPSERVPPNSVPVCGRKSSSWHLLTCTYLTLQREPPQAVEPSVLPFPD